MVEWHDGGGGVERTQKQTAMISNAKSVLVESRIICDPPNLSPLVADVLSIFELIFHFSLYSIPPLSSPSFSGCQQLAPSTCSDEPSEPQQAASKPEPLTDVDRAMTDFKDMMAKKVQAAARGYITRK